MWYDYSEMTVGILKTCYVRTAEMLRTYCRACNYRVKYGGSAVGGLGGMVDIVWKYCGCSAEQQKE